VWNAPLDGSGVLRALEHAIFAATGVAPRSWDAHAHGAPHAEEAESPRAQQQAPARG
jgi:hypothetical protein